jgi:bifunctional isochorismate lyase/aryl carrier protein
VIRLKEQYFFPDTIELKARDMRGEVEGLSRHKPISFNPECAALLVLDMQAYFLNESSHAFIPSAAAILPRIQALDQGFKSRNLPIIYTRHINSPEDAGMMAAWWKELITSDHPLNQIIPELILLADRVMTKTQYDSFYGTNLEEILRGEKVRQVLISGVMTHLCCAMTACSAFMRGFEVFFLVDATATYSEKFHRATLLNLSHGFAVPVLTSEILRELER